ncbi:EamA family transporter RarD [Sphingomonas baiyangensis]|uniref:EamA family transporter RarD n=1 Tax=Sphingomonas baiyangensis TaxID=2572576 RepID=A0A4U1L596_9SPHN|nr:EamA family transporter RarD [Sphingomonas baiyangensis]
MAAYGIWGMLPLFFLPLAAASAGEVVASRILWSLALLLAILGLRARFGRLRAAFADRRALVMLAASATCIAINWLIYIWAVQHGQVLAASLGYFLNPLVNVALGMIVLKERLSRVQAAAVGLAAIGVLVLAVQAAGALWISLGLAFSFAFYGLIRKLVAVESLEGLTVETILLTPPSIAWLAWLGAGGALAFGTTDIVTLFLILSGVVTAVPLLLFAAAARRLPYSMLGLLQYLAPTLQFLLAVLVLGETMTTAHIVCFACIWSGLLLYVAGNLGELRRPRPA